MEESRLEGLVDCAGALNRFDGRLGGDAGLVVRLAVYVNLNVLQKASESGTTLESLIISLPSAQEMEFSPLLRALAQNS